jgi:hypothetical protein
VTIAYVPLNKYPTGTLTFQHNFPETGKFIGLVTVKNAHGQFYVSQFPFLVGQLPGKSMAIYGVMIAALVAAVYGFWQNSLKPKPPIIPKYRNG